MSSAGKIAGVMAFSVAATLALMTVVVRLPGMEPVPVSYWLFAATCPALISGPVAWVLVRQANAIQRLHDKLQHAYDEMRRRAETDQLTGVWNRAAFDARATALQSETPGCLLVVDVDHFKAINDVHGHQFGDEALRQVAAALSAAVRPEDVVGRVGGEEFAIYLAGANAALACHLAERARAAVEALVVHGGDGQPLLLTASIGLTKADGLSVAEAVRGADRAMYRAKSAGRNRVHVAV